MKTAKCPFCGKKAEKFIMFRGDIVGCQYCGINIKQTNADRIRSMSDEELAGYMSDVQTYGGCPNHGAQDCQEDCSKCWLDWLRQEAQDGEG